MKATYPVKEIFSFYFSRSIRRIKPVRTQPADRFIYVVGEQQNGVINESAETFVFTQANMQQIDTTELALVIANVFARGQFFPGHDGALAAVFHELTSRSELFKNADTPDDQGRCTLITAFKRLDGEISVKVAAIMPVDSGSLSVDDLNGFETLLQEKLPDFQHVFTEEAYAPDSKIMDIIKKTALHHINKKLQ